MKPLKDVSRDRTDVVSHGLVIISRTVLTTGAGWTAQGQIGPTSLNGVYQDLTQALQYNQNSRCTLRSCSSS